MAGPIRVALIGLSASPTGTGWAASAHLPYLLKSPHFKITALLNTSVSSAQKSIDKFNLGAETKAYGSPEDLAQDPNVDLVVVNTRVDQHGGALLPSLKAGKDVFCEWPLEKNSKVAKTLVDAAKSGGGRTVVGLQARESPVVNTVKKIIESGRIGAVFSSFWVGTGTNGGNVEGTALEYTTDRKVGGNLTTIHFGHAIDYVLYTLGEPKSINTILANQIREVKIVDKSNTPPSFVKTVQSTVPDQILLQAELSSGAVLSFNLRGGPPMPSSSHPGTGSESQDKAALTPVPHLVWRIYGEKGEIEVTSPGPFLNVGYEGVKIRVHDHSTGKTEEVDVPKEEGIDDLPLPARNIGRVYDRYAEAKGVKSPHGSSGGGLVDFEQALQRHKLIDSMMERWDQGRQGWTLE